MTQVVRVGDIAVQVRGVTYQKQDAVVDRREGYVPLLRAGNITDSGLDLGDLVYVPPGKVSERQVLQQGDVLIAASSGSLEVVGKAAKVNDPGHFTFGAFCKVLRPSSKVDPNYFAQFFKTPAYRRTVSALAAGANINNLRNGDLDNLEIPLPPLDEQRRIAAILDKADEVRAKRKAALETLETLGQAIFIEMFGDPVTNPMGWPEVALGDVAKIVSGATPKTGVAEYWDGGVPWAVPRDLSALSGQQISKTSRTLSQAGLDSCSANLLPANSVLMSSRASIGLVAINTVPMATNQGFKSFIPKEGVLESRYLYWWIITNRPRIELLGRGATFKEISTAVTAAIKIPLPPLDEQAQFACLVAKVREEIRLAVLAIVENDHLFESLQEKAFKGAL